MAQPRDLRRELDWSSAAVEGATLSVQLTGSSSKQWSERFTGVLAVLDPGRHTWGEVKLGKAAVKVADVREGAEGDLRHLLESVVLQVNSDLSPDEPEESGEDERESPDERMASVFRSFAGESASESETDSP